MYPWKPVPSNSQKPADYDKHNKADVEEEDTVSKDSPDHKVGFWGVIRVKPFRQMGCESLYNTK